MPDQPGRPLRARRPDPRGRDDPRRASARADGGHRRPRRQRDAGHRGRRRPRQPVGPPGRGGARPRPAGRACATSTPGVQVVQWHMPFLLTEEATDPGITAVYNELMTAAGTATPTRCGCRAASRTPPSATARPTSGTTFGATVLAVRGGDGLVVSPPWEPPVPPGATLYYVAGERIDVDAAVRRRADAQSRPNRPRSRASADAGDQQQHHERTVISTGTTTQRRLNRRARTARRGRRAARASGRARRRSVCARRPRASDRACGPGRAPQSRATEPSTAFEA